jgi:proline dehydrogenase
VLKSFLLYLSNASWARGVIKEWSFSRRAASRFVAGDVFGDALTVVRTLNEKGLFVTLDHLGENVTTSEEAASATDDYLEILDRIVATGVKSNISVKLTQLGLNIDLEDCLDNMRRIARKAAMSGIMVRIDIEDSKTVDRTWHTFRTLRAEGLTNIGLAIQSYLYRSKEDARALLAEGAHFRLCKGAYQEPAEVAFPRKADVDTNYDNLAAIIIDSALTTGSLPSTTDGRFPPVAAIATHDPKCIAFAREYADRIGFPKHALEFQMLYGIRSDLQELLSDEGYPVRIYVPFGTEWYPYLMRRLAERPANVWFFLSNLLRN